jgi:hypothetical protein
MYVSSRAAELALASCKYWTAQHQLLPISQHNAERYRAAQALAANGAKVYITGRRMDALENAVKTHNPKGEGQIVP